MTMTMATTERKRVIKIQAFLNNVQTMLNSVVFIFFIALPPSLSLNLTFKHLHTRSLFHSLHCMRILYALTLFCLKFYYL